MATSTSFPLQVLKDHAIPVVPPGGAQAFLNGTTTTLKVTAGDTLYYADNNEVSSGSSTITSGNSATVSVPTWVNSAGVSSVLVTFSTPGSVVPGKFQVFTRPGNLATETSNSRVTFPTTVNILSVTASVNTAPTGAAIIVDVLKNGTTIWGTNTGNRPTIAINGFVSGAATPDTVGVNGGDYLQVQIVQVGSTIVGADLTVSISYS